jgi:hypothetical protein
MTQDEIIEMWKNSGDLEIIGMPYSMIESFAKLVALRYQKKIADLENIICQRHWDVLQEREACAKLLEATDLGGLKDNPAMQSWVAEMLLAYVKAIRARGQA